MVDWEKVGAGGTTSDLWRRSGRWSMGFIFIVGDEEEEEEQFVSVIVCSSVINRTKSTGTKKNKTQVTPIHTCSNVIPIASCFYQKNKYS